MIYKYHYFSMNNIYCRIYGGLVNRLRTLIGYIYVAKKLNLSLHIFSLIDYDCPIDISKNFNHPNFVQIYTNTNDFLKITGEKNIPIKECTHTLRVIKNHGLTIDKNLLVKTFLDIQLTKSILDKINLYISENDIQNCIGIHLRRSDHWLARVSEMGRNNVNEGDIVGDRLTNNESAHKLIRSLDSTKKILLCTDCENTYNEFYKSYPDRIFRYGGKMNDNRYDMMRAIFDMYLLMNCKEFYGTYYSSYSVYIKKMRMISNGENILECDYCE